MKRYLLRPFVVPSLLILAGGVNPVVGQALQATKDDGVPAGTRKLPGETIDYTIVIQNTGAAAAGNVALTDPTPAGTTMVAGSLHASPVAIDDAYSAVGNTKLYVGATPPAGEAAAVLPGPLLTANDSQVTADGMSVVAGTVATALGGSAQIFADGSFVYTPPVGSVAQDSFDYTLRNAAVPALTGTGRAVISFNGLVWHVNGAAAAGGNGTSTAPFNSLASLNGAGGAGDVDAAGDIIHVMKGNAAYAVAFRLENNQTLTSESTELAVGGYSLRAAVPANVPSIAATSGAAITLASGNTVRGFAVSNTNGKGISGSSIGTTVLDRVTVTTTNGTGIEALGSGTFSVIGSENTVSSTAAPALVVQSVNIAAAGLNFRSLSSSGGSTGVTLTNTGSAGGLTVTGDGTNAARGGNSSGGTITGATGADGATADDGAANGVGIGIHAVNAGKIVLRRMTIENCSNFAVEGESVTDLTLQYCTLAGTNGSTPTQNEGTIRLLEAREKVTLDNLIVAGGVGHNIRLDNNSGTLTDFVVSNSQVSDGGTSGDDGILIDLEGSATVTAHITGNTFANHAGDHIQVACLGTAIGAVSIESNQFTGTRATDLGGGIFVGGSAFDGSLRYKISNNTLRGTKQGGAILAFKGTGNATMDGTVTNNVIGVAGQAGSGATLSSGIRAVQQGNGTHTVLISGNTIRQYGQNGIEVVVGSSGNNGAFNGTVTNNTLKESAAGVNGAAGVLFTLGTVSGNTNAVQLDFSGNDIAGAGTNNTIGTEDFRIRQRFSTNVALKGYSGGASDTNAVLAFLQSQNLGTETGTVTTQSPGQYSSTASVPQPTLPLFVAPLAVSAPADPTPGESIAVPAPAPAPGAFELTDDRLHGTVERARSIWTESGIEAVQTERLQALEIAIADLPGRHLGRVDGLRIELDRDAAGHGWSFDDDVAPDRLDLLTTVLHEMGHAIGLDDVYVAGASTDVMNGFLVPGSRRLPALGQALGATPHAPGDLHFLDSALVIGTLPPGDSVTVVYSVTVDAGIVTPTVTNQGTITATGLTAVLTDDPTVAGAANATVTTIELAPTVSDIAKNGTEDTVITFATADFAAGFVDANGDALASIEITSAPAHGSLLLNGAVLTLPQTVTAAQIATLTFEPAANYAGTDSFDWKASDGTLPSPGSAKVNITLAAVNDNPVAGADSVTHEPGTPVKIAKSTLLANDTDPENDTVAMAGVAAASAQGGTVSSDATTVYYTPAAGFTGNDSFTYTISDGQGGTATGTVSIVSALAPTPGSNTAKIETLPDGSKRVTFAGIPGRTYRIQSSDVLTPAAWTDRASVTADEKGAIVFTDPPPLPSERFYRTVNP